MESRDIGSKGAKEALADVLVGANEMQTAAFLAMLHQKVRYLLAWRGIGYLSKMTKKPKE